jgi:hypothetical protein
LFVSTGHYTTLRSIQKTTPGSMKMKYASFNGYRTISFHLADGEVITINFVVESISGQLDVTVSDQMERNYYSGENIQTSTFSVRLEIAGEYRIKLVADKHQGSYDISWEIQK